MDTVASLSAPEQLRSAGLRVTAPRLAVLAAVAARPHADVDQIALDVRARIGSVSTQAVYDVLRALTAANLLRRIEPAGSPTRFETRVGDNHHHAICRSCGTVVDIDCTVGQAPCLEPSAAQGFSIDEAEIVFWGLCEQCRGPSAADPDTGVVTTPPDHQSEHR